MKDFEVKQAIEHSMRTGAARILDQSCTLHDDPRRHAEMLTRAAVRAQRTEDQAAWDTVVNATSRLVFRMSETYFWKWSSHLPAHASFDDVFMAGLEGLTIGVRKFDPSLGFVLTTYVTDWIRTKVQRACYAQCGAAHIPEHLLQKGLDPSSPLVASSTGSLDHRAFEDGPTLGETLESGLEVDARIREMDDVARLLEILRTVDERMPEVAGYMQRDYADREIARLVGITAREVSRLRSEAMRVLESAGY